MATPLVFGQNFLKKQSNSSTNNSLMWVSILLLLLLPSIIVSQSIIKTLPGFPGNLPFKLETGYMGVGELDEVQLFYYFIESERDPQKDPLMLWLTGGPGCSALSGLIYEIGLLNFNFANSSGKLPSFVLNPYSWTKVASIIFLDAPVGTGFSYSRSWEGWHISDTKSAAQTYSFLRKWLIDHPKYSTNPLYISGDSYSGIVIPIVVQAISDGNEAGLEPEMNLQGYILGNPLTDTYNDFNSRVPFAHRVALLSDALYESTKASCNGKYLDVDPGNALCVKNLQVVTESYNYLLSYIWANDMNVQNALHIRKGTIKDWVRCNDQMPYTYDVLSSVDYHRNLSKKPYRALIYSGDHDMLVPYVGTQAWIESLNLTIEDDWEPWFVNGQVAGFTVKYSNNGYDLTFATVKGAGHTAPEYKPVECLAMIDRWFAYYPL